MKITEDKFNQYKIVREGGLTNMFNIKQVIELSDDLTKEEIIEIMENYEKYVKEFGEEANSSN